MGKKRYGRVPKGDLIQILLRLPVKSLGRFKMVSKSWCALIESSSFFDLHSYSKFGSFILLAEVDKCRLREQSLFMLSSSDSGYHEVLSSESGSESNYYYDEVFKVDDLGGGGSNDDQLVLKLGNLGVPPGYESYHFFIETVGSCNGLVCLYDRAHNRVSLWNPATKNQHRILPEPMKVGDEACPDRLVAFGFDVKTKDYQVVLLTGFDSMFYRQVAPMDCPCRVQVYNLSTDSWRLIEGITCLPGFPFKQEQVLYLNGSCFFMAHFFHTKQQPSAPENDRFIISFDLTKEIITPIQLPDHHEDQKLYLSCLADKIALFTISYPPPPPLDTYSTKFNYYNIWVLNEHGSSSSSVKNESWERLHSFQIEVKRPGECNLPRGISNDGKFALLEASDSTRLGKKMMLYHLDTKEVKMNFLSCSAVMSRAHAYEPSLVSILGGNGAATAAAAAADRVIGNGTTNL